MREKLREFALSFPGAYEAHPWGEDVAKVHAKIFVFLGPPGSRRITVKLDESHGHALAIEGAEPTGYGLGKAGWVSVPFASGTPPLDVLKDWVEESYRLVAPKKLVAELDRAVGR